MKDLTTSPKQEPMRPRGMSRRRRGDVRTRKIRRSKVKRPQ